MSTKKITILNKGLLSSDRRGRGDDKFRKIFGAWSVMRGNDVTYRKKATKIKINILGGSTNRRSGEFYNFTERCEVGIPLDDATGGLLGENPKGSRAAKLMTKVLDSMKSGRLYGDFATLILAPTAPPAKLPSASVRYEYNLLDEPYERELQLPGTKTLQIPNIYAMSSEALSDSIAEGPLQAPLVRRLKTNKLAGNLRNKFTTQMVLGNPSRVLNFWGENKHVFPMYAEVNIPTGVATRIADDLQETNLAACLMRDIAEGRSLSSRNTEGVSIFIETPSGRTFSTTMTTDTININDFWSADVAAWALPPNLPETSIFFGADPDGATTQEQLASPTSVFPRLPAFSAGITALRGKIDLMVQNHKRSYTDLLDGKKAHSEMLMYRVLKYVNDEERPTQVFYFYNSGDQKTSLEKRIISLIDTQVKYDQKLSYVVTAYVAVIGSEYTYGAIASKPREWEVRDGCYWTDFEVTIKPTLKIFDIPILHSAGRIVAPPPYYPQSSIEQIKGMTHGMLFSFDTQVGKTYEEPVNLSVREVEISEQFLSDPKRSKGEKILYETEVAMSGVQIFRTEKPPTTYNDFRGNLLKTISTDADLASNITAGSVAKIIRQTPNEKFYYMFRSVGFHGEVSNPSPVYEVELHNDGGVAYPIVKLYEMKDRNRKTFTKPLKNLLHITPSISQAIVNESASGLIDENGVTQNAIAKNIVLGLEDEPLFGKTFKVRLTSRDTGRKIDINLSFKTKVVKTPT